MAQLVALKRKFLKGVNAGKWRKIADLGGENSNEEKRWKYAEDQVAFSFSTLRPFYICSM